MKKVFLEKKSRNKLFIVFISFSLAVLIYLLFRSRKLFYYQFVELIKLDSHITDLRKIVWIHRKSIPNWVIYSLPDGLWLFSMGVSILNNRIFYKSAQKIFNLIFFIMIGIEVFQQIYGGHGTFIGTFDGADVVCYTIGYILASALGYRSRERNSELISKEDENIRKKEIKKILIIVIIFTMLGFLPALVT